MHHRHENALEGLGGDCKSQNLNNTNILNLEARKIWVK